MAIPGELAPDPITAAGIDQIIQSPYDQAYAQQLIHYGLPVRPALGKDRRARMAALDQIINSNESTNALRYDLAQGQLATDQQKNAYDLAGKVAGAFDPANEEGIAALLPVQEISDTDALDAILHQGSGTVQNKNLTQAELNHQKALSEPVKAKAALIKAKKGGAGGGGKWKKTYAPDGTLIGIELTGNGQVDLSNDQTNQSQTQTQADVYGQDQTDQQPIESQSGSGNRLIRNSDGSGTLVTKDGRRLSVTKENMAKYGF